MADIFSLIEAEIRRDPGRRGLLGNLGRPLGLGELESAARSLAESCTHAVLLTGFYIPLAEPPAAETDGPPGAVALAQTLQRLGRTTTLVTDSFCGSALTTAAVAAGLSRESVFVATSDAEFMDLITRDEPPISHLIAIERVGPGYTDEVLRTRYGDEAARRFADCVPREFWSRCLNMRGLPIEDWTVDFSRVFEAPPPGIVTIGIGDGGNELGLGKWPWTDLEQRLNGIADPRILCRVAADYAVVAGTSNWAAYGLAAATAIAAGRPDAFADVTTESQTRILKAMVRDGPAVDGVTRQFEATVDGLPLPTYLEPLEAIHRRINEGSSLVTVSIPTAT